ncbi:MAG: fluoride efflux transporter CrcB [Cyanobacteria bacterium QS_7_48_42]|nr:MAG: fluoride efflux transporter CrcB [Cyanobacteria bacterium QH_7_48_89]PSO58835.1 MAG: fluoride efflux transporter CrcB [Cyanobacteria bacterium QH_10_48_56]PSO64902.1 MAG: fluoride efflux transporter CrcB [Cyanobacteria bacterium QH_6_48_35]PSO65653.1 MAG: fluoride efflux transporter CrcB [Cyanobacteria bacterium QH_2_48_84]PSO78503.1 MAG: fluoride efflux transporter CrcB [Cyanobacteria bacterium QH_3_48_40]PSP00303.1 MAG: fluoride efflux transporter CrcB [Cyanobacteria bacterium SW_6_4
MLRHPIAISLGAIAGALSRYYLSLWFAQRFGTSFPYGTLFVNFTGCLGMGFFVTLALEQITVVSPEIRSLVAVGFLGSYTTFSSYELDTLALLRDRHTAVALLYWLSTAVVGLFSAQLGVILARLIR